MYATISAIKKKKCSKTSARDGPISRGRELAFIALKTAKVIWRPKPRREESKTDQDELSLALQLIARKDLSLK